MGVKNQKMKGIELFCGSPASTLICNSTVTITKPLHRLNSYLANHYKNFTNNLSVSQLPPNLTPSDDPRRKSSSDVYHLRNYHKHTTTTTTKEEEEEEDTTSNNYAHSSRYQYLSSSDLDFPTKESSALLPPTIPLLRSDHQEIQLRKSKSQTGRVPSLMNPAHNEACKKTNTMSSKMANPAGNQQHVIKSVQSSNNDCDSPNPLTKSSSFAPSTEQVVALRVSLHCRACEAKLRKHLSRMEGVTSFSIDTETKKVVVIGKMRPSDVLKSISKVKNAQFWQSPTSSKTAMQTAKHVGSDPKYLVV